MTVKLNPITKTAGVSAVVDGVNIVGQGEAPGVVITKMLGDQHSAVSVVWEPTKTDLDGFPNAQTMRPITVATTGSVG